MKLYSIAKRFRIDRPDKFRLSEHDPAECYGLTVDKSEAKAMLARRHRAAVRIAGAALRRRPLVGADRAAGDGRRRQGQRHQARDERHQSAGLSRCIPSSSRARRSWHHDFLWRVGQRLPASGRIGIFNRSHYEEVLTVRVHRELLERQKLPHELVGKDIWQQRFDDIRAFERHLARNGTLVLKFFLNVSKDEQRKRFLDRIDEPAKRWKFSMGDVAERKLWDEIHGRL